MLGFFEVYSVAQSGKDIEQSGLISARNSGIYIAEKVGLEQKIAIESRRTPIRQHIAQQVASKIVGIIDSTHVKPERKHIFGHFAMHTLHSCLYLARLLGQISRSDVASLYVAKPFLGKLYGAL